MKKKAFEEKLKACAKAKLLATEEYKALADFNAKVIEASLVAYDFNFGAYRALAKCLYHSINVSFLVHSNDDSDEVKEVPAILESIEP